MDFNKIIGHEDIISRLRSSIETDRVGHADIFAGEEGSGRATLAYCFAKALQCESDSSESCDSCKSCKQAESGNHPDIIYLTHDKIGTISVSEIREQVVDSMQIKPYSSRYKIYIIKDAEKMTEEAQNALLKTIEEPPEYGIVIFITSDIEKLLQTIRSRCIVYTTKPVKEKDIHDFLVTNYGIDEKRATFAIEYAGGNLGKAILLATNEEYEQLIKSVIYLESNIFEMDMEEIADTIGRATGFKININDYLDLMMMWYRDILVLNYLSFNELESKQKAIVAAKERINANAKMEDIMRLLILTLKQK